MSTDRGGRLFSADIWRARGSRIELDDVDRRISSLRKFVASQIIHAGDQEGLRCADEHLRDLAGKGVNDFLAEFVHPPIEFF